MITIRLEKPEDIPSVRIINERAFRQPAEADIVDKLRQNCPEALSLVAEDEGYIVGHTLFTPVMVETDGNQSKEWDWAQWLFCQNARERE